MATLLEGIGLKKTFRGPTQTLEVLQGVDLSVSKGEILVIVGPSGAGKSTLLYLLGGLDQPTAGEVRFRGKPLYRLSDRERSQIRNQNFGFVFQFYHLVPELTALENVLLPGWMNRAGGGLTKAREKAKSLLEQMGLKERFSHPPAELSGGEQQRVAIARALVNQPDVLFCDEPTGNLDSETGQEVLKLLLELNRKQGTTLVIVTHEPAITQVAGRMLSLKDGRIWAKSS